MNFRGLVNTTFSQIKFAVRITIRLGHPCLSSSGIALQYSFCLSFLLQFYKYSFTPTLLNRSGSVSLDISCMGGYLVHKKANFQQSVLHVAAMPCSAINSALLFVESLEYAPLLSSVAFCAMRLLWPQLVTEIPASPPYRFTLFTPLWLTGAICSTDYTVCFLYQQLYCGY